VAFAAKEAGYKAVFPIGGAYIGFQEASIDLNWQAQRFHIRYHGDHQPNRALESGVGYWRLTDSHVIVFFAIQD
jgi:4'-phosphopantetheinyl transferase EntD